MRFTLKLMAVGAMLACAGGAMAQQGETVRIALIEGVTGPLGNVGTNMQKSVQFLSQNLNAAENPAGVKFEIVPMDSKSSPQEALNLLKSAIDQGIRYVAQGNGSNVGIPLSEAVAKNNARNPGKEVVYLNYAAVDPDLTNSKCNYWHFSFDGNTSMKMAALTNFMKGQPDIHKVYLNNQNYSHGHQVAKYFKEGLARNRPDVQVVGEDYVPLAQVKDFAPYVAKIKAAGADTLVTGSWGQDFTLLVKALNDAGLNIPIYAYYAGVTGTPTALAQGHYDQVYQISYGHSNYTARVGELMKGFKAQYNDDLYALAMYNMLVALSHAMAKAGSTDPVKVAAALSDIRFEGFNGESQMRKTDHQLQQGMWISHWQKVDGKNPYSVENTGYTFAPVQYLEPYIASTPTTCQMKLPN